MAKGRLFHLVTRKADVGVSFKAKDPSKAKDAHFKGCRCWIEAQLTRWPVKFFIWPQGLINMIFICFSSKPENSSISSIFRGFQSHVWKYILFKLVVYFPLKLKPHFLYISNHRHDRMVNLKPIVTHQSTTLSYNSLDMIKGKNTGVFYFSRGNWCNMKLKTLM